MLALALGPGRSRSRASSKGRVGWGFRGCRSGCWVERAERGGGGGEMSRALTGAPRVEVLGLWWGLGLGMGGVVMGLSVGLELVC